jgi:2-methylisocitrate lyase-like PEP mutase family enzyme
MSSNNHQSKSIDVFRELHESGCFILPNPFDVGSAIYLHHLGFKALATTSAGFAFAKGLPDEVSAMSRELVLCHVRDIVAATPLPVNADFQNGYADEPADVADSVRLCVETGVAGLSIEDNSGNSDKPLYDEVLAIERIKAAREAIDNSGQRVVLTARCEAFLVGTENPFDVALKRLIAFAEAGADCLYAPGVTDLEQISRIVKEVGPRPINVLVSRPDPKLTLASLRDLDVRRISVGSAFARVAWGAFIRAAQSIASTGEFSSLDNQASFVELNELFGKS